MSESWNGITLAEVRNAYFRNIANVLRTVQRLADHIESVEYEFDTGSNGAVIISNNYMSWEFIAPNNYTVTAASTVDGLMDHLAASTASNPVSAWEDFAGFLNEQRGTINLFLTEGGSATITDANNQTYAGTQHLVPGVSSFSEIVSWMKSWLGSAFLAADSSVVASGNNSTYFSLTAGGTTIECTFKF